jgi:hypothetical protein
VLGDGWNFSALSGVSTALPGLALWPAFVAVARVAEGKHYPLDVLVGYLVGITLAWLAMGMGRESWAVTKYAAGSLLTVEALALLAVPKWRLPGTYVAHIPILLLWWVSLMLAYGPIARFFAL